LLPAVEISMVLIQLSFPALAQMADIAVYSELCALVEAHVLTLISIYSVCM
jgi:hypothetical protein